MSVCRDPSPAVAFVRSELRKEADKARRARALLLKVRQTNPEDSSRGPYGNLRDPESGWFYGPRIRRVAVISEIRAKKLRALLKELQRAR